MEDYKEVVVEIGDKIDIDDKEYIVVGVVETEEELLVNLYDQEGVGNYLLLPIKEVKKYRYKKLLGKVMEEEKLTFEDHIGTKSMEFFREEIGDYSFQEIEKNLIDVNRWTNEWSYIFKHKETGRFIEVLTHEGSSECQEDEDEVIIHEVYPKQVVKTIYSEESSF